ncbi:MAG: DUF6164 family protein [Methylomonas sp.]|jgi:hypothetical protein|uniref:DUF6164 family protein n=1 Tax=Methylomonas sp. TaxID=418 RepID=UPI0025D01BF0|nr:DUF6164 family protein [Methylomonas sp.]MCK9608628.1 DUF6164 family protein [Methylomonas sp.]
MSILFFNLRGVPEDEAEDIRELLSVNGIAFYETSAGIWGISLPAIWLQQQDDMPVAQQLFQSYQRERAHRQRALYEERQKQGRQPGFLRHNLQNPLRFIALCLVAAVVIYASCHWVYKLGL